IPSLPVRPTGLPAFQRCVLDPHRQAAPPPQARLVGRPVPHLERHLRDVVTAIGVVFVRHREQLEPEREEHPTIPGPAECTNAPVLLSAWPAPASIAPARASSGRPLQGLSGARRRVRLDQKNAAVCSIFCEHPGSSTWPPPRSMPPCWTRASIVARSAPCIASWPKTAKSVNGATNSAIRSTRSPSCWPRSPTRSGRGTSRS